MRYVAVCVVVAALVGALWWMLTDEGGDPATPEVGDDTTTAPDAPHLIGSAPAATPDPTPKPGPRAPWKIEQPPAPAPGPFRMRVRVLTSERVLADEATLHVARSEKELVFAEGRPWTPEEPYLTLDEGMWWVEARTSLRVRSKPRRVRARQKLSLFLVESDDLFLCGKVVMPDGIPFARGMRVSALRLQEGVTPPTAYRRLRFAFVDAQVDAARARYDFGVLKPGRHWIVVAVGELLVHGEVIELGREPLERDLVVDATRLPHTPVFVRGPDGSLLADVIVRLSTGTGVDERVVGAAVVRRRDGAYLVRPSEEIADTRSMRLTAYHAAHGELVTAYEPKRGPIDVQFQASSVAAIRLTGLPPYSRRQVSVMLVPVDRVGWSVATTGPMRASPDKHGWCFFRAVQPGAYVASVVLRSMGFTQTVNIARLPVRISRAQEKIELRLPALHEVRLAGVPAGPSHLVVRRVAEASWVHQSLGFPFLQDSTVLRYLPAGSYEVTLTHEGARRTVSLDVPAQTVLHLD